MLSDEVERVFRGVRCPRCHSFSIEVEAHPLCNVKLPRSSAGYMVRIRCGQCGEESTSCYGKDILEGVRHCVKDWRKRK